MKASVILIATALMIGAVSCNNTKPENNQPAEGTRIAKPASLADYDLVLMENGQLVFYHQASGERMPFTAETDSVVNAVYDSHNNLYYSVSRNQQLSLKGLKLDDPDPKPVELADWMLQVEDCLGFASFPVDNLLLNKDENMVGIQSNMVYVNYSFGDLTMYDVNTHAVNKATRISFDPETGDMQFFDIDFDAQTRAGVDADLFEDDEHGSLYYLGGRGGRVCVSDKLNYPTMFDVTPEELIDEDIYSEPISLNPQGTKVLFLSSLPWGDYGIGSFNVANLDGSDQWALDADNFGGIPTWLKDGSLVFVRVEDGMFDIPTPQDLHLMIMSPEGAIKELSPSPNYAVKPF